MMPVSGWPCWGPEAYRAVWGGGQRSRSSSGLRGSEAPSRWVPSTVAMLPRRQCGSPGRCFKLCFSDETFRELVLKVKSRGTLFLAYFFELF